ncbi:MAG: ATP-binding protein [bacterium]
MLGISVYLSDRKSKANCTFLIICLCLAFWNFATLVARNSTDTSKILFWGRLTCTIPCFIPSLFLYFSLIFPKEKIIFTRTKLFLIFLPPIIIAILSLTNLIFKEVRFDHIVSFVPGAAHLLLLIYTLLFFIGIMHNLIRSYLVSDFSIKLQLKYILLAGIIYGVIVITTNLILPTIGIIRFEIVGSFASVILIVFISYALAKYRLMNFENFIKKIGIFTILITTVVGSYIGMLLNPHSLPLIIGTIANFSLGSFVYLKDRKNIIYKTFFLLTLSFAFWHFHLFGLSFAPNKIFAMHWADIFGLGLMFLPATALHFTLAFTKRIDKKRMYIIYGVYMISLFFYFLHWTKFYTTDYIKTMTTFVPKLGVGYQIYMGYFGLSMLYIIFEVFKKYSSTATSLEKVQMKYFFIAILLAILIGSTNFLLAFGLKIYPIGNFATIVFTSIIAYAIVRHRLMGIEIIIRRGVIYGTLTIIITAIYGIIVGTFHGLLGVRLAPPGSLFVSAIAAMVIAVSFLPLRNRVQLIVDKLFFRERLDYQRLLQKLINEISSIATLDELLRLIVNRVTETMHINTASIFLADDEEKFYMHTNKGLKKEGIGNINFSKDDYLIQWLYKYQDIFLKENVELRFITTQEALKKYEPTKNRLEELNIDVSIPLFVHNKLIGIFNLSNKQSGDIFNDDEIGLLLTLGNHAAIAIENIKLIEAQLALREELMQTDKLAAVGTVASEIAHDLKNPLAAISNYVQLIPLKFNDPEFIDKFNKIVPDEINRMNKMLIEFLKSAKLPEPKFSLVDIGNIIDKVLQLIERKGRGIRIITDYQLDLPKVMADEDQLKQVFMNLILNSFQAMPKGGRLTITTKRQDAFVNIEVKDTGCGIKEEYLKDKKLFKAFVTTKEKGTGLGLAICQWIIKRHHHGKIDVKSEVGKGTTFTVSIPLQQPSMEM